MTGRTSGAHGKSGTSGVNGTGGTGGASGTGKGPPGRLRRFRALLTRPRVAGPAWWSVLARLPVYLMSLAMVLVVREQGGSFAHAGSTAALYTLGMALGSPLVARRVDRGGRRAVLLTTGVVYPAALTLLVTATRPGGWAQPVLAVTAGIALPPANAVMRSLWARLPLTDEERETAYLWEALLTEFLVIGAPLILAGLMLAGPAGPAVVAVAAAGGAGALGLALTRLPPGVPETVPRDPEAPPSSPLGPLRAPALLALTAVMAVCAVPIGLLTLAVPAFTDRHGATGSTGAVYACWGVGSALGALWLGRPGSGAPVHRRFPWLVLAFALGTGLPLLAVSPLTLGLALAVGGIPIALVSAGEMTLVSQVADDRLLTEAFTWASLATVVGDALGQQAGGLLIEPRGPRAVFALALAVALAGAALAFGCRPLLGRGVRKAVTDPG
ncbi:MFS transporter [Streptomyces sp. LP05-1]|uniref:MFS transporter n=1 Tax=Streptomyces pyxinae TaxID=2970734 RepID=A0ABT2CCG5_9ACTN|nr:MFS transporter [Streptomyces sp. LP05-1]MCS0634817.1 MFS transporter [Streptomyces sp. LP05-1]